ncbi:non-ribosomal peptide synthetase [Streptomyces hyaluromycini]|uniref:non-ribosomal peptide synthetase n=1 Tax=Streptomyces hyaluromycini TaxID=1377993 RepID=UPI001237F4F4|nr:non-ribosomal peptide synthetase [Streptomyces hyaluromycini]
MQSKSLRTRQVDSEPLKEGLHDGFARIARSHPKRTALITGNRQVSYGELNSSAEHWAVQLEAAGVSRSDLVPIVLPRSVELVVGLLAVLKLGAAYALLDPQWPLTRLNAVIDELDPPLVVGPPDMTAGLAAPLWSPSATGVERPNRRTSMSVRASDPCCVFFTSGTTGRPKGVVTPHGATTRLFRTDTFADFGMDTVIPLAAATPWDAFSLELWGALYNGGTSVLIDEPFLTPTVLRDLIASAGANTVWLTSSLFNLIVDEDLEAMSGLSQVMTGGERLSVQHVRRFLKRFPDTTLINGYGPVESTVFTTTHRIEPADCARPGGIPLGRAVPGTSVFVLDGSRMCAVGETGEICVAGDGLALGYLGQPELTAEKFTYITLDGEQVRVYRTGDLGAWQTEGVVEFQGRIDRQVKVRGNRVEPAEVERQIEVLAPSVSHCQVVPRWNETARVHELIAFCIPVSPGDVPSDLQTVLEQHLPSYQRPVAVIFLDSFPLTARGKLDEQALLARVPQAPMEEYGAPIADAWVRLVTDSFASVLGVTGVPPQASFFELGGSSLTAARACARIGKHVGRPIPLSRMYEYPTAEQLGPWLHETQSDHAIPPLGAGIPLTPMELVFLTRHLVAPDDRSGYCQMFWQLDGVLDQEVLEGAVATVHERHQSLRTAFRVDPLPSACVSDILPPALELQEERGTLDDAIEALVELFSEPLEPQEADLWRTALVPVAETGGWLFGLVVHHIAFDGWSESVLARDLSNAYSGRSHSSVPPTPTERALLLSASAAGVDLDAKAKLVCTEFQDVPEIGWPEPPGPGDSGTGRLALSLPAAMVEALDARGKTLGAGRFAVLLSAWANTVAEVCDQGDFAVGIPVAQRTAPELKHAIGCFITMVPLRLRGKALLGGAAGVHETERLVRRAFSRSDVPFPTVAQKVGTTTPGRPPVFQILFAMQDNDPPVLNLAGITSVFIRQPYTALPLELHLEIWPESDGGLRAVLSFQREATTEATALELLKGFDDRLASIVG